MSELRFSPTERPLLSSDDITSESIFVATLRLANLFNADSEGLLKEHGLTSAQYNTLRVLRDAPQEGLSCQSISAALIQRDPDVTRLADRLEERGLVVKQRAKSDRRVVCVKITDEGLKLVNDLDWPVARRHIEELACLSAPEKAQFLTLLQKLLSSRSPCQSGGEEYSE
jgi:DNA-binding MarR family transcriptional regulator